MNPHEEAWVEWVKQKLEPYLREQRGRQSAMARHLHVRRQNVHRWLARRGATMPGWAAVATNIWLNEQLKLVPRSADKPLASRLAGRWTVSPQGDKLPAIAA